MAAAIDLQEAVQHCMLGTMNHALWTRIKLHCLGLEGQSLTHLVMCMGNPWVFLSIPVPLPAGMDRGL